MSHTLTSEEQISVWITNVRHKLEGGDIEAVLAFLDILKGDWEKYRRGEPIGPITIHTGNKMMGG